MTPGSLPSWPAEPVAHGPVVLRRFSARDVPMARELSTDPYVPFVGTLPANASREQASDWVDRQRGRWAEGAGFSFAIAEASTDRAVGGIGLWLSALADGRATAGYWIVPSARGRGFASAALIALTSFGWTIPALHRMELYIEPWNAGSIATAERAGYQREGLLRSHQEIGGRRRACCSTPASGTLSSGSCLWLLAPGSWLLAPGRTGHRRRRVPGRKAWCRDHAAGASLPFSLRATAVRHVPDNRTQDTPASSAPRFVCGGR